MAKVEWARWVNDLYPAAFREEHPVWFLEPAGRDEILGAFRAFAEKGEA